MTTISNSPFRGEGSSTLSSVATQWPVICAVLKWTMTMVKVGVRGKWVFGKC